MADASTSRIGFARGMLDFRNGLEVAIAIVAAAGVCPLPDRQPAADWGAPNLVLGSYLNLAFEL